MRQRVRARSVGAILLGALVLSIVAGPVPAAALGPLDDPSNEGGQIDAPPDTGPPVADQGGCPADALIPTGTEAAPAPLSILSGEGVLCPGTYPGGIDIGGTASVDLLPGIYTMAGGGFAVSGSASVTGLGVMIVNSTGATTNAAPVVIATSGAVTLHGMATGPWEGLTVFQDPAIDQPITFRPGLASAPSCPAGFAFAAIPPAACGAIGGLAGMVYAPNANALVSITGDGVADLQVVAGRFRVAATSALFTDRRPSSTTVACSPGWVVYGGSTVCTATVSDAASTGTLSDPAGDVTIAAVSGPGTVAPASGVCTLVPDGDPATFTSACSVTYTPLGVGTGLHSVSASFGGSAAHAASVATDDALVSVQEAASTVTVSCPSNPTWTGEAQSPCFAWATGAGMTPVDVSDSIVYTGNISVGIASADAYWSGDPNHTASSGTNSFTIIP